eukprot:CAMPEP_0117669354 /NCGR_PEP_ID=MMETSP0804-20121206/12084_1 /TAXON_ID=1074897 /ORGANISM="Tetraselmis astigmatica, Strain CCMP880" /LENGTH=67 /DNA_ID=CAMNT_0005477399 /DNA_START=551 /DNA_END=754 /DNA_ORIENTATION=-
MRSSTSSSSAQGCSLAFEVRSAASDKAAAGAMHAGPVNVRAELKVRGKQLYPQACTALRHKVRTRQL